MKKKTISRLVFLAVTFAALVSFIGCDLALTNDFSDDDDRRKGAPVSSFIPEAYDGEEGEVIEITSTFGYQSFTYGLWAGQNQDAGIVTISNDEQNIYVDVETFAALDEVHVYVYSSIEDLPSNRPAPGLAPYSVKNINENSVTVEIPVSDLTDGTSYYFIIHAALVGGEDSAFDFLAGETAYAAGPDAPSFGGRGAWFYAVTYVITEVVTDEPETEDGIWGEETAWAGDSHGPQGNGNNGWWFYFDTEGAQVQAVFAGQKEVPGASVSYNNGTLLITLGPNMRLQDGNETVKIQGYNLVPDSRPAAGQFSYKGTDLEVPVDAYQYYAIHLDVEVLSN